MKQELPTLSEHVSSPSGFCGFRVAQYWIFCVLFPQSLFLFWLRFCLVACFCFVLVLLLLSLPKQRLETYCFCSVSYYYYYYYYSCSCYSPFFPCTMNLSTADLRNYRTDFHETWWSYRYMCPVDPTVFRFVVKGVKAICLGVQKGWGLL